MKIRRAVNILVSLAFAVLILFALISFLQPEVAQAQNSSSQQQVIFTQGSGDPLKVSPDPPQVHEPTELRVVLFNEGDNPIILYAQFYGALFGLGTERFPIADRLEFILPPHAEGSTAIVWVPPLAEMYSFYVDIFDAPQATIPVASYFHNTTYRGLPNPETPFFIEEVPFLVRNPFPESARVTMNINVPVNAINWEAKVYPQLETLDPGELMIAHAIFTYTAGGGLPPGGMIEFLYSGTINGLPLGEGQIIYGPPLRLHMRPEPPYAESEISVNPYPVKPGEPVEVCVEVRNVTPQPRQGQVIFRLSPFGIGLPFQPFTPPIPIFIPQLGIQRPCVFWVPPYGGQFAFDVQVEAADFPMLISSRRVVDVNELLLPGSISTLHFPVGNPFSQSFTLTLGLRPYVPDWMYQLSSDVLPDMQPGEVRFITLTLSIPSDSPMPPDGSPVTDVEAFAEGELIGGFRKIYRPPVPIHQPADPIYAEREITVNPYPPQEREPTEICVELRNPTFQDQVMMVDFRWAEFGIGLPWQLIRSFEVTLPANGMTKTCSMWVPPFGGRFGIEVGIESPRQERIYSQRVIDVGEILLPNQPSPFVFPVGNPYPFPITVTMAAKLYLPQWEVVFNPLISILPPGAVNPVEMTVTPIQNPGDPEPTEGQPVIDVEAYWEIDGGNGLLGGFRKLFTPPIAIHPPQDPPYAEGEISIIPYPPHAGEPTEISFDARNPTADTQQITVTFEVGNFGIGLSFHPIAKKSISVPPGGIQRSSIVWVPPFAGEFCARVKVEAPFFAQSFYSSRNISIVRLPQPYGLPEVFTFVIGDNGIYTRPLTLTLGLREFLPDWHVELKSNEIVFPPGQTIATAVMTITPPVDPDELPVDGGPIADVSAYVQGELIGGLRKVWRPPVPLGNPQEPSYAESEIVINPDPPVANNPATFAAQVRNNSDYTQTVTIQFGWADFGFGIPFTTTNVVPTQTLVVLSPHMTTTVGARWTPAYTGHYCVEIILNNAQTGEELHSQRNVDVIEVLETQCESFTQEFLLSNPTNMTVTVSIGESSLNLPPGWKYSVSPTEVTLGPYESIVATAIITPPCELNAQGYLQPLAGLDASNPAKIQVEGYDQNGKLIGGVELQVVTVAYKPVYLPFVLRSSAVTAGSNLPEAIRTSVKLLPESRAGYLFWSIMLLAGVGGLTIRRRHNK